MRVGVSPWFSALSIWEVIVGATNSNVEDEEELPVEWCIDVILILPWVVYVVWETAFGEHVLIVFELEHSLAVKLGDNVFLGPLKLVGVETIAQVLGVFVLFVCHIPGIVRESWTKVECGTKRVNAADIARSCITSALHDVNLATCRPLAELDILRKHPYGRPDPVALRQLCTHLNSSILEVERVNASEACARDWVDVVSAGCCVSLTAVEVIAGTVVALLTSPETVDAVLKGLLTEQILGV